jgi:nitrite reductase (NO-forming)
MFDTTRRKMLQALGVGGAAATLAGCPGDAPQAQDDAQPTVTDTPASTPRPTDVDQVAADPTDVPDPIDRDQPETVEVTLSVEEVTAEVEPGVTHKFLTFDGQVPGPMIRVRQGDTVEFTMENGDSNDLPHNVDFHAVYGTGGGAVATTASPGSENKMKFQARYPGAFIYHCAVPRLDYHISAGMFGMILVEPEDGLPEVDREFYLGQHELYTDKETGTEGHHALNPDRMRAEDPTYVLLNGEKYAWAAANRGPLEAEVGETVRVYMVCGGPNISSNFHPIGNVWSRAYRDGGLPEDGDFEGYADRNIQTMKVPPGSCMIGEMEMEVPERIKLVDHALSRVRHKGLLAEIDVQGTPNEDIYDPDFDGSRNDGPMY